MKRRLLLLAVLLIIAALVMLFGCGACCVLSKHRCAGEKEIVEAEPKPEPFSANGIKHQIYDFGGNGPDVILLHELPGLSGETIELAKNLGREPEHYSVHVPLIFGGFNDNHAKWKGFGK